MESKVVVMKKYTDKELAAMSQEELKALQEKALEENKLLGQQIEKILANASHPNVSTIPYEEISNSLTITQ